MTCCLVEVICGGLGGGGAILCVRLDSHCSHTQHSARARSRASAGRLQCGGGCSPPTVIRGVERRREGAVCGAMLPAAGRPARFGAVWPMVLCAALHGGQYCTEHTAARGTWCCGTECGPVRVCGVQSTWHCATVSIFRSADSGASDKSVFLPPALNHLHPLKPYGSMIPGGICDVVDALTRPTSPVSPSSGSSAFLGGQDIALGLRSPGLRSPAHHTISVLNPDAEEADHIHLPTVVVDGEHGTLESTIALRAAPAAQATSPPSPSHDSFGSEQGTLPGFVVIHKAGSSHPVPGQSME